MDIKQIRLDNALRLLSELKINKSEFARRLGKSPQNIHGYLLASDKTKNIGHNLARLIESTFNKAEGWLDQVADNYFQDFQDTSCSALYARASAESENYIKSCNNWQNTRTQSMRSIEDNLRKWLLDDGITLMSPPKDARYDYSLSSGGYSLNLFVPFPEFARWDLPIFEKEQPDFLAIALMPGHKESDVSYFVLSRPEYLHLAKSLETDFFDVRLNSSEVIEDHVYLCLSVRSGIENKFEGTTQQQLNKLWKNPQSAELELARAS